MKAALDGEHARPLRRRAADLDRRLDGLGARVREEHAPEPVGHALEEGFGEKRAERVDPERELAGRLELERLDERGPDVRVVPAEVVHPEAAEHVEVPAAVRIEEVLALGPRPVAIEADRPQHPHELRVDRACVQLVLAPRVLGQELPQAERRHALSVQRAPMRR